jgi:hypothetical protein
MFLGITMATSAYTKHGSPTKLIIHAARGKERERKNDIIPPLGFDTIPMTI